MTICFPGMQTASSFLGMMDHVTDGSLSSLYLQTSLVLAATADHYSVKSMAIKDSRTGGGLDVISVQWLRDSIVARQLLPVM